MIKDSTKPTEASTWWAPITASLHQGSYPHLGPQAPPLAPHSLSSLQPPEEPCEHLSQVPPHLLCPQPSRAPTSLGVKAQVLP